MAKPREFEPGADLGRFSPGRRRGLSVVQPGQAALLSLLHGGRDNGDSANVLGKASLLNAALREVAPGQPVIDLGWNRITRTAVQERTRKWETRDTIRSNPTAIGHVMPTDLENELWAEMNEHKMRWIAGAKDSELERLLKIGPIKMLVDDFMLLAKTDLAEAGIEPGPKSVLQIFASPDGYTGNLEELWHTDVTDAPMVRYVTSIGENATIGAIGNVPRNNFKATGNFLGDDKLVRQHFHIKQFDPGTMIRLLLGDMHASPKERGRRIILQYSVFLS